MPHIHNGHCAEKFRPIRVVQCPLECSVASAHFCRGLALRVLFSVPKKHYLSASMRAIGLF